MKRIDRSGFWLALVLALAPATSLAQVPAGSQGEAPGGSHLAPAPADRSPADEDPAHARGMAFAPSAGECRESVPGGTMLAVAYAVLIGVMGAYLALVARRGLKLEAAIDSLEREIQRRSSGTKPAGGDATS